MMATLLIVAAPAATWADRGKTATVLVIIVALIVVVVRWATRSERTAPLNEEDEVQQVNSFAPNHPANRLTLRSRQVS